MGLIGWGGVGLAGDGCKFHAATVAGHDWFLVFVSQPHSVLLGDVLGERFGFAAGVNEGWGDVVSALNNGAKVRIETGGDENARGHGVMWFKFLLPAGNVTTIHDPFSPSTYFRSSAHFLRNSLVRIRFCCGFPVRIGALTVRTAPQRWSADTP